MLATLILNRLTFRKITVLPAKLLVGKALKLVSYEQISEEMCGGILYRYYHTYHLTLFDIKKVFLRLVVEVGRTIVIYIFLFIKIFLTLL